MITIPNIIWRDPVKDPPDDDKPIVIAVNRDFPDIEVGQYDWDIDMYKGVLCNYDSEEVLGWDYMFEV